MLRELARIARTVLVLHSTLYPSVSQAYGTAYSTLEELRAVAAKAGLALEPEERRCKEALALRVRRVAEAHPAGVAGEQGTRNA
jgi:hypothetical protein